MQPETKDVSVDILDEAIHTAIGESALKMIPYLKAIVAFHKTWETLRDQLFLKKVLMFLRNPSNISEGERVAFFDKLKEDPKEAQKLSDSLVLLLDKMDDMDKAEMLAKIFEPYVKGKIPFECFRRLASAIDLGFLEDLQALASAPKNPKGFIFPFLSNLIRTGLAEINPTAVPVSDGWGQNVVTLQHRTSPLGKIYIGCMTGDFNYSGDS